MTVEELDKIAVRYGLYRVCQSSTNIGYWTFREDFKNVSNDILVYYNIGGTINEKI